MKVKIEDGLYLESDDYQYILKRYTGTYSTRNKGKEDEHEVENYRVLGYYSTVTQAVNKLIEMELRTSSAETLEQLIKDLGAIKRYIEIKLEGY